MLRPSYGRPRVGEPRLVLAPKARISVTKVHVFEIAWESPRRPRLRQNTVTGLGVADTAAVLGAGAGPPPRPSRGLSAWVRGCNDRDVFARIAARSSGVGCQARSP